MLTRIVVQTQYAGKLFCATLGMRVLGVNREHKWARIADCLVAVRYGVVQITLQFCLANQIGQGEEFIGPLIQEE